MKVKEKVMEYVFLLCACVSILAVALICIFLFANGLPAMKEIGVFDFLLGKRWKPGNDIYGIFPMILGSIYVTAGAIIVGVPIGLLTAVYLAKFCPAGLYKIIKPGIDLLAGIPSVVYGFFGLCVIVPAVRTLFKDTFGGNGQSIFTASVLLGIMILPTIIGIARSKFTGLPVRTLPSEDRRRVSCMTSAVKLPAFKSVTVRHTPLTAMLSPILVCSSTVSAAIVITADAGFF